MRNVTITYIRLERVTDYGEYRTDQHTSMNFKEENFQLNNIREFGVAFESKYDYLIHDTKYEH